MQKHFRCVPGFIKTADRQFPPKFTAKYIRFSDSEITGKLAGNQSWCFQNGVFTLQRKKKNYHLSPRQLNNELSKCEVWCNIDCFRHSWRVDWHVQSSVLCSMSNELIMNFKTKSSHHSGKNVSEKTIKSWTKKYHTYEIFSYILGGTIYSITQPWKVSPQSSILIWLGTAKAIVQHWEWL